MQDLSSLGLEPMLFAVEAQGVLTTGPPGKCLYFKRKYVLFKKKKEKRRPVRQIEKMISKRSEIRAVVYFHWKPVDRQFGAMFCI